ncbi:TonB-dependent receptor plug domain-containing protein [Andreprevotia chitinilytica]|uniref:TonB-dependent receptor plug domain-containing protein n=1 Tax=Andreprevotia chitinilytica TaxID=396808 RepID=UPI000691AD1E|nr:TonB-dependent receptor [Andreprevotia chitinilytica]
MKSPAKRRHHPPPLWAGLIIALCYGLDSASAASNPSSPDLTSLSLEELANIEISSVSKHAEPLSDAATAIFVITHEDIRRAGVTSIPEALRLAPNLEVAQSNAYGYQISARGFNNSGNKLLVLIDGRAVYTPLHSGVFWDVQDVMLEDIDRIEVISGPGGTLWGSNAVNGVINILTKSAKDTQGALVSVGGGNTETGGAARYGAKLDENTAFRLYAKGFERNETENAKDMSQHDAWRMKQAGFRLDGNYEHDALTVQGDIYDGAENQATFPNGRISGNNVLTRWSRPLANDSSVQVQAYYDHIKRTYPGSYSELRDTWDIDLQHNFKLGEHHDIVWGGGYRSTNDSVNTTTPFFAFVPANNRLSISNVFAQDAWAFSERWKLTVGAKLERNNFTGTEFQPDARLAFKQDEHTLWWAAISRAVRTPSLIDRDFYVFVPGSQLRGGPDFHSEKLTAYELGYRAQPLPKLSLSVSTFYNVYADLRSIDFAPGGTLVVGNQLEGRTWGVETWATYQLTDAWRLSAGYNALRERFRAKAGSNTLGDPTANTGNDPAYQWSLRSSLNLPHDTELDATLRTIGALPNPAVPSYTALDVHVGWHVNKNLELSLAGFNLLDAAHPESGSAASRSEFERSFLVRLTWTH